MALLDFDFHARKPRFGILGLALLLAGGIALAWAWSNLQASRATEAGLALQIAALKNTQSRPAPKPITAKDSVAQATLAQIKAQLAYSWQPAFDALASSHNKGIALLSLEAAQAKSQIKLVAEARQLADAIAYIEVLQQQPGVKRAALTQHEIQADLDQKPVRFNILVELGQ